MSPADEDRAALEVERVQLDAQVANLTEAIKSGGDIPILVAELRKAHARLGIVRGQLQPAEAPDRHRLREALTLRVADWRDILRSNPAQGRRVLQELIGPIELWLDGSIPAWVTHTQTDGLIRGVEGWSNVWRPHRDSNPGFSLARAAS